MNRGKANAHLFVCIDDENNINKARTDLSDLRYDFVGCISMREANSNNGWQVATITTTGGYLKSQSPSSRSELASIWQLAVREYLYRYFKMQCVHDDNSAFFKKVQQV